MTIADSLFTNGTNNLINGNLISLDITNVTFYNSTDFSSSGHAIKCVFCFGFKV